MRVEPYEMRITSEVGTLGLVNPVGGGHDGVFVPNAMTVARCSVVV